MINKSIINAVLGAANKESKDIIILELLNHISMNYDYNDNKASHVLEMLVDSKAVITTKDINLDYINKNPNILRYNHDDYNIRNIKIASIDNIDATAKIEYEYLEKINEDRDDISYVSSYSDVSFIDNPDILKK